MWKKSLLEVCRFSIVYNVLILKKVALGLINLLLGIETLFFGFVVVVVGGGGLFCRFLQSPLSLLISVAFLQTVRGQWSLSLK